MYRDQQFWHAGSPRIFVFALTAVMFWSVSILHAQEYGLAAPDDWGGETIKLPPGFAPTMSFTGVEHIRFAPGMMQPKSDSFFSYAFVFELDSKSELSAEDIEAEFLKYYRGLCKAVLGPQVSTVDTKTFTLQLKESKGEGKGGSGSAVGYDGILNWVEPFRTRKPQKLNLEIHVWKKEDRRCLFACVSPKPTSAEIWTSLREIRRGWQQTQLSDPTK